MELIVGELLPRRKLPFELPSSVKAVEQHKEDAPNDSKNSLSPFELG